MPTIVGRRLDFGAGGGNQPTARNRTNVGFVKLDFKTAFLVVNDFLHVELLVFFDNGIGLMVSILYISAS